MKLSKEEVLQIASLACLDLTEKEIEDFGNQLSDILAHFESLQKVNTITAVDNSSTLIEKLPFREDIIKPFINSSQILAISPKSIENQFIVPAIFETKHTENSPQGKSHDNDA